jgi:ribonuclease HI
VVHELIDKTGAWAYFDGASQGNPLVGGARGSSIYWTLIKFKAILGGSTNNKTELMALKLVLMLNVQKGLQRLHAMRDSMIFIIWLREASDMQKLHLRPIYEEVLNIKINFNEVSFCHVDIERNILADALSKEGLQMTLGTCHIWIQHTSFIVEHDS